MTQKVDLKVFCFYWSNTRSGITDANGTTHYFPEKRVVIAKDGKEARATFKEWVEKSKEKMRSQMKGYRPDNEIEELIEKVCYIDGLFVRKFPLREGLVI